MSMPLEGVRVLDWTIWQVGGISTVMLGMLGAEVIKLESKDTGAPERNVIEVRGISAKLPNGHCYHHEIYNRNKKSLAIDLRKPEGREVIYRLVKDVDVFVQNFRKGTAQRYGMDYKTLSRYNPKLIYANAWGLGPEGPDSDRPAMDLSGIARAAFMMTAGDPGTPPQQVGAGMGDNMGSIYTAYAVLAALFVRERLGIGQEVDTSMLGGLISLHEVPVGLCYIRGVEWPREGHAEGRNPLWNWYECKDGKWIAFSHFAPDPWWPTFCQTLGLENLIDDLKFNTMPARRQNRKELLAILDKIFATKTRDEWLELFSKVNLCYSPVNSIMDLYEDPQVVANDYIVDFYHPVLEMNMKFCGLPIKFSKTQGKAVVCRAPEWGEHTEEVLTEVGGFSWEEIAELREKGVI